MAIPRQAPKSGADCLIRIRPKYYSAGRSFRVPGGMSPMQAPACINRSIYRTGNTAEMGRVMEVVKVGKPILTAARG